MQSPQQITQRSEERHIAILLFDGMTALDAIGPYEVLSRIPRATVTFVAESAGVVRTGNTSSLGLHADKSMADVLSADVLVVPGGGQAGIYATINNAAILDWIRLINKATIWTVSICTGSLILGAAGLLRGLSATSHWASGAYLETHGATYTPKRFIETGKIITAAGVSAGIDMALHLAARLSDDQVAQALQLAIEYDPDPPYHNGNSQLASRAPTFGSDLAYVQCRQGIDDQELSGNLVVGCGNATKRRSECVTVRSLGH